MTKLQPEDYRCFHRLRVRWVEVDIQKIVFNAHYLMYFDTAMMDYWRALALPYETSMAALQGDIFVKKVSLEYHASAHLDDQLDVAIKCERIGTSSIVFKGDIFRGRERLVSGDLVYVYADPVTQKSKPVPTSLRAVMLGFENREDMLAVALGDWKTLAEGARAVRHEVFVQEQQIPIEMEQDDADQAAVHALIRNRLGVAVATGRLLQAAPGVGQIGRLAVTRVLRGSNLGRFVLHTLMGAAAKRGDREVFLHAQSSAEGFYTRLGFLPRGEPFMEAGIGHREMVRLL